MVLCGGSAGSLCWFTTALSAFHEGPARRLEGLGLLPWSNAVHLDSEEGRGSDFIQAVAEGLGPGYAASDGAALHFVGTELAEVIASERGARAVFAEPDGAGGVTQHELAVRDLGAPAELRAASAAECAPGTALAA